MELTLIPVIWLMIFAHFVGDYVLKTEWLSATKGKNRYNMLVHCVLYAGSVGLVLMHWVSGFPYCGIVILFISHWLIDDWKCRFLEAGSTSLLQKGALIVDQVCHFSILALVVVWYSFL